MVPFSRAARLTVSASACLVALGAAPAASWGQKTVVAKGQAIAAPDGAIQVTGTRLADTLTVLRREGTRFVRITANRPRESSSSAFRWSSASRWATERTH